MKKLLMLLVAAALITSCSTDSETKKVLAEIASGYEMEGREVALTGYLSVPRHILATSELITLGLYNAAGQSDPDKEIARVRIRFGQGPDSYYVPERYTGSDVEIYDSEGVPHGYLTKVRLTGRVRYTAKNWEEQILRDEAVIAEEGTEGNEKYTDRIREARDKAEERRKRTGDPNDYSFVLLVDKVEAL